MEALLKLYNEIVSGIIYQRVIIKILIIFKILVLQINKSDKKLN